MSGNSRLVIFGASGHAKVVIDTARDQGFEPIAVVDDDPTVHGTYLSGVPVFSGRSELKSLHASGVRLAIVAIGANQARSTVAAWLAEQGFGFPVLVHSRALVAETVTLGAGTVVMPGAIVNADAVLGEHVIVNTCASVDHDCTVGDFVHIAPGVRLCGGVHVGESSLLGVGTSVIPCQRIGCRVVLGAGSVVIADIPDDSTCVGTPATPVKKVAEC